MKNKVSLRQVKLLENPKAKIILANNSEAEMMIDLTRKLDEAIKELKDKAGSIYEYADVAQNLKAIQQIILYNSEFLKELYKNLNKQYNEPTSIALIKENK